MKRLYFEDAYLREFDAEVVSCIPCGKGFEVTLTRSAFFPEGGGQPADTGVLGGVRVLDVQEKGERVIHLLEQPLEEGTEVHGIIDWDPRFERMQEHSGEHIVSGLIHRKYGYDNVGFHMGEEIRLDLNGPLTWEELMEIEKEANEIVFRNVPLHVWCPDEEELHRTDYRSKKELTGEVRLVEIPGADICACCGTHVRTTGEIGPIKFLSMIHYKGGVRIMMHAGRRAMEDYRRKTDSTRTICDLLSAKPYESAEAVKRFMEQSAEKDLRISSLLRELLELRAEAQPGGQKLLLSFETGMKPVEIRKYCDLLVKKGKGEVCGVFSGSDKEGVYSYCIGSTIENLQRSIKILNETLNGRGGGSPQMVQGTFTAGEKEIRSGMESLFL